MNRTNIKIIIAALAIMSMVLGLSPQAEAQKAALAAAGTTTRVSVSSSGEQGNEGSYAHSISADGRYVAFVSYASNLVTGDTNGTRDVFVHDRQTGTTSRVSVGSSGAQGNDGSGGPSISADGRYVAFESDASNLIAGDTNATCYYTHICGSDVFVHDRQTGTTTRVSVSSSGEQGDYSSFEPSISADGRYVAFYSHASTLVARDTNTSPCIDEYGRYCGADVFVHDRLTGATSRVSVSSSGAQGNDSSYDPAISADGRYVAFESYASNLVAGDTNGDTCDEDDYNCGLDIFVHDRQTGTTSRVSVSSRGEQAMEDSLAPSISADGRYVAFRSYASNLVAGDTNLECYEVNYGGVFFEICRGEDIFVHDRQTNTTSRVSVSSSGEQGNGNSFFSSISADGRYVAFASQASTLVAGDTNGTRDVFVHDRQTGTTSRVSVSSSGEQGNFWSWSPSVSADGRYVAFTSYASTLVAGDTNGTCSDCGSDVFVHDRTGDLPPTIAGFTPAGGPAGTSVTITGTNLSWATGVAFNGTTLTFTINSDTQITAVVPAAATTGKVSVTTPGGTVTSSNNFTVMGQLPYKLYLPTIGR